MIALTGLTLSTGNYDIARSILRAFVKHVDQGMLPNHFPDGGEAPEYNTVDATLWFFEAARALFAYSGDEEFVRTELYPCSRISSPGMFEALVTESGLIRAVCSTQAKQECS
jgi:predicted glycogen debranching enzyme